MTDPNETPAPDLTPIEPAYAQVIRVQITISVLVLLGIAVAADFALVDQGFISRGMIMIPVALYALFAIIVMPGRRWQRWAYARTGEELRVVRGWLFRSDTIVPWRRVQHIDVDQGPVERMFGLATITVHTAGTHNSTVSLPGLKLDDANDLRDAMRARILKDAG